MCFIVNVFSARRIFLRSRLSPSDWANLPSILKIAGTTELWINTEVDWEKLETVLINTNKKMLGVSLISEVKYESETWDHIKRLATLCERVTVGTLRLSEGSCVVVDISTGHINIQSGDDLTRLEKLLSQYVSWEVDFGGLHLTELGSDDWALLAQLLPTLTRVWRVEITSNSTSHPAQETLRQLWHKTVRCWEVNDERYEKSDDENFNKMFNKYFK